ncbi:hypothetical protein GCM10022200_28670 [Microbacterium awajiense]|uniref:histidine kinase n=1 Tax=Microbacterium awajiense TaxID=415214 RepID=A0ABP7AXV2_9MICO
MRAIKWWDLGVAAASVAVAAAIALDISGAGAPDVVIAVCALGLFIAAYVLIARPGLVRPRPWTQPAFVAVTAIALAAGCAGQPFFAVTQAVVYPLVWVLSGQRRRAIVGTVVIGFGVFVGFAFFAGIAEGGGRVVPAVATAGATATFGVAFAIAFGLWITGIVEYGEERARLVAELTAAQGEIEALSLDRGAAAERERLSRDIHDTLAQTLAGLALLAERAGRQLESGRADAAAETIGTVERLSRDALAEAREIVARTAAVPSDTALGDAVQRLADRFRAETGLTIDLALDLDVSGAVPRDTQLVVLRCLQEALSNVRKHAAATAVSVGLTTTAAGAATLEVQDDGRGFDPAARPDGFGLDGMRDRVALAGGVFEVASGEDGGTTVSVSLPAEDAAEETASASSGPSAEAVTP